MADVGLAPVWQQAQFFDNNGNPLVNGKIWTYIDNVDETIPSWTDKTGTVLNTNPIILDSAGRIQTEIWIRTGEFYCFVLQDNTGTELSRVRDVTVVKIVAGNNVTIDPPSGFSPTITINAAGSVGNPLGRGQTFIFSGANQPGLYLTSSGGNFSSFDFQNNTVIVGPTDVSVSPTGLFNFHTPGTYTISITTKISCITASAWPMHETVCGVIFGATNKSYHTRYSTIDYDGLAPEYQQVSFTDMFTTVALLNTTSIQLEAYLQNADFIGQPFDTTFTVLVTRIGN